MRKFTIAAAIAALSAAAPAHAETGDMLVKVRGGYSFRSGTDSVTVNLISDRVTAKAADSVVGEAALTFFLTDNVATEVSLGGGSYDINDAAGRTLASSGLITPTLTLQYHLMPGGRVRPYIGVGAAYVSFYSEKPGEILTNQNPLPPVSYAVGIKSNIAPVGQIGADVSVNDKFYVNIDGRYMIAKSKLTITQGSNVQTVKQDTQSFVVMAGVGFKF